MVQSNNPELLLASAGKSLQSLESLSELICAAENLGKNGGAHPEHLSGIQRKVLLDSFTVKKFHRDYKEWEHAEKDRFIEKEVKPYNQKYAQMSRVYNDFERLDAAFEDLRKTTQIPGFDFSIETIQKFENGSLLGRVQKDATGQYPKKVPLSDLFALDADSNIPAPSFPIFNRLVNLEYRLRMLLHIKHEVLLRAKAHLSAKNIQWASRDAKLNLFLTRDFKAVHEEIAKIKASEHEDLKYYEDDFEEEDEDEEEDENVDDEIIDADDKDDKDTEENIETEEAGFEKTSELINPKAGNGHIEEENKDAAETMDFEMAEPAEIVPEALEDNADANADVQGSTETNNGEKEEMELD